MNFLDLFAGIGGFRLGMEAAGHKCIGYCEIDKFARASYEAIHNTKGEIVLYDIRTVSDKAIQSIGHVDVICGGFPCQAFSVAGKREGFADTRGTLFFEISRFASILKPRILFFENVKGLLNHDKGRTFETIIKTLDELGYDVEWQVLNSKNFGVPQNRERVFIIGHLRGTGGRKVFPIRGESENTNCVRQIGNLIQTNSFGGNPHRGRVYSSDGISPCLNCMGGGGREPKILQIGRGFNKGGVHNIAPTITKNSYQENNFLIIKEATKKGYAEATIGDSVNISNPNSKTRRGRVGKGIANTLLTGEEQCVVMDDIRIRKLTPKECWRLQGFPDWAFERAAKVNSNSQLYKQAGNSVTVNVIEAIAKEL